MVCLNLLPLVSQRGKIDPPEGHAGWFSGAYYLLKQRVVCVMNPFCNPC